MSRVFASQAIRIRQTGVTQSLQVPGLFQPVPIRTGSLRLAEELDAAFNAATGAVSTALTFQGIENEREIEAQEGLAAEHWPALLAEARQRVDAGGLTKDQSPKGISNATDTLFNDLTEGHTNAYRDFLRPRFNAAIIDHSTDLVKEKELQNANVLAGKENNRRHQH